MEKEFYGNGTYNGNDSDASGKPFPATFGPQESEQVKKKEENEPQNGFGHSNKRLDSYYLHFSSRL